MKQKIETALNRPPMKALVVALGTSVSMFAASAYAEVPEGITTALTAFAADVASLVALYTPIVLAVAVGFKLLGLSKRGVNKV